MPRQRNPVGIAAGKLILAIRQELDERPEAQDAALTREVMRRAHTLLQASQSASVLQLLDGRSVVEYLGPQWAATHPAIEPSIKAFIAAVTANERV